MTHTCEERPATGRSSEKSAAARPPILKGEGNGRDRQKATSAELGRLLRDEGIARANGNTDAWWASCFDAALAHLAACDVPFSADQVLELVPEPDQPSRVGGRFHGAVHAGLIRPVGYVLSDRPSRRRGVQRLYRGGASR